MYKNCIARVISTAHNILWVTPKQTSVSVNAFEYVNVHVMMSKPRVVTCIDEET